MRATYGGITTDGFFPISVTPGYVDVSWVPSPAGASVASASQPGLVHVDVAVPADHLDWILYRASDEPSWSTVTVGAPVDRTIDGKSVRVSRIEVSVDGTGLEPGYSNHLTFAMSPNVTGVDGSGIIVAVDGSITVDTLPPTPLSFTVQLTVLSNTVTPDESALFTSLVPQGNTSRILRLFNTGLLPMDYRLNVQTASSLVGHGGARPWLDMGSAVDPVSAVGYGVVQPFSEVRIPLDVIAPGNSTDQFSTNLLFDVPAHFLGTEGADASLLSNTGAVGAAVLPQLDSIDSPTPLPVASAMQLTIPIDLQVSLYTIWPQEAVFTLSPESSDIVIFELLNMAPIYNLDLTINTAFNAPEWIKVLLPRADSAGRRKVQLTTDGRLASLWLEAANFPGATGQASPNHLLAPGTYTSSVEIVSTIRADSPGFANVAVTPGLGTERRVIPVTLEVVVGNAAPETTELRPDRELEPTYKIVANDAGPHQLNLVLRDRYGFGPPVPTIPEVTLLQPAVINPDTDGDIDVVVQPVENGNVVIDILPKRIGRVAVEVSIDGAPVEGYQPSPILVEVLEAQCDTAGSNSQHILSADRLECLCAAGFERVNAGVQNITDFTPYSLADPDFITPVSGVVHGGIVCQACREGFFKSVAGNTIRCSPCGDGKFSRSDGKGCNECPSDGVLCVAGNLRLESGFWCETCLTADDITPTMLNAVRQQRKLTNSSSTARRMLQSTSVDTDSDEAVTNSLLQAEVGTATSFHSCIPEEACEADGNGTAITCIEGHSGILCSECESGWAKSNPQGLCSACWETGASVGLSAVMFIIMFALVVYIALKTPSTGDNMTTALLRIASTWAQLASLLLTARLPPRSILDDVINVLGDVAGGVPLQSNPIQCTFGDNLGFYRRFYLFLSLPFVCLGMGLVLGLMYLAYRAVCTKTEVSTPHKPVLAAGTGASMDSARSNASSLDFDDAPDNAVLVSPGDNTAPATDSLSGGPVGEPERSMSDAEVSQEPAGSVALSPKNNKVTKPTLEMPPKHVAAPAESPSRTTMNDTPVDEGEPSMWSAVRQKGARATLVLLFLAHFSVTKATLLVLDTFDEPLFGFIRFRSDLRHGEFDDEYDQARSLAYVGLIFFGLGLPVAAVLLLAYYKYDLNRSHTRNTFGFLYMGYRLGPGALLGSARAKVVLQEVKANPEWARYRPKTCGWMWTWLLGDEHDEFSDGEDEDEEYDMPVHVGLSESKHPVEEDGADDDPTPAGGKASKTGAIITEDEAAALSSTGYWSWEFIIVARKIVMTTVSVTVRAPFTQSALMVMILTASLCLHVSQSPFASSLLNAAETAALVVLWISAMSGVVLYEEGELSDATAETVRGLIVTSNTILMVFFAFILLYALSASVRHWAARQYRSALGYIGKLGGGASSPSSPFKSGWGSSLLMSGGDKSAKHTGGPLAQDEGVEEGITFAPEELKKAPVVLSAPPTAGAAAGSSEDAKTAAPVESKAQPALPVTKSAPHIEEGVEEEVEDIVVPIKS